MPIRTDSPQVAMLRLEAETQYGHPVKTPSDFIILAGFIEQKTGEHMSDSTIKRLWTPSLAYRTVSLRTLNVLSQYVGFKHFDDFLEYLADKGVLEESEMIAGEDAVRADDLKEGAIVSIAWMPDRECKFKFLGGRQFEAIECHNSTIKEGDTFYCSCFIKGRKLFVDKLLHEGTVYESYVMGTHHGLTRVELEPEA